MKTAKVALGYKGLTASNLANYATTIYNGVNGNTNFTISAVYVPLLLTANATLNAAVGALKPGDKVTTSKVHDAESELKRILRVLAATAEYESNNSETVLLTSGFSLKTYTPPSTKNFNAKQGTLSGTVDLETNSEGYVAYLWEMSLDPIGTWTQLKATTVSKTTVAGLIPGTKYWFRVAIVKGNQKNAYSDPYMVHVI